MPSESARDRSSPGGSGGWGNLPTAPNDVRESDLKPLVEWILSQR